jgi:hypothetical protein
MSTTLTRPEVAAGQRVSPLRLDPVAHRRRPALAVGSLALVVACVAVFASVYLKAGSQEAVLAVNQSVPQGHVLTAADLTVVHISTNAGISTVPVAEDSEVVGRRAAEPLEPGTLLTQTELVTSFSPPAGDAIVGVAVKEGQLPASGVVPGETVDVILTGTPGDPDSAPASPDATGDLQDEGASSTTGIEPTGAGTVLVSDARVLEAIASPASSGSDSIDVSLLTASTLAPLVASASAADQVALVVVVPGS